MEDAASPLANGDAIERAKMLYQCYHNGEVYSDLLCDLISIARRNIPNVRCLRTSGILRAVVFSERLTLKTLRKHFATASVFNLASCTAIDMCGICTTDWREHALSHHETLRKKLHHTTGCR
jgi:hypothetical protein